MSLTVSLAVLGLHAIKNRPIAIDGKVEIRPVCLYYVDLTVDLAELFR